LAFSQITMQRLYCAAL